MRALFFLCIFVLNLFGYERSSSYPYLSGDTWRFFCDWVLSDEDSFDPKKVKRGDTIFVEHGRLWRFEKSYLPKIKDKFILISANAENGSDNPLPGPFSTIVEDKKVVAWFIQNIDCDPNEKLIPIPIGLANRFWPHGNPEVFDQYIPSSQRESEFLAYVNFSIGTNSKVRAPCFHYFSEKSWAFVAGMRKIDEYLEDLTKTTFVISPPGNGLDCHRTWEALLMNCYPVVLSNTLNPLYMDLPVVIVDDWSEVTEEFLLQKKKEFDQMDWSREKLYADYWFEKVRAIQTKLKRKRTIH